jgi:hypothetical protein
MSKTPDRKRDLKSTQKTLDFFAKKVPVPKPDASPQKVETVAPVAETPTESKNNPLEIWCWNVNGIRATIKSGAFDAFLSRTNPQVLCLNETKVDEFALNQEGIKT